MPKVEATNGRLISKCTAYKGSRKQLQLLVVSVTMLCYYKQQEVLMYAYNKLVAKNGSHELTAHISRSEYSYEIYQIIS